MADLYVVPLQLRAANALIQSLHRHHPPARGHLFSLGAVDAVGEVHGAAVVSRPIARGSQKHGVAEVTRLVSDGTANVCSMLLAAARRAWFAMGGWRLQTYTLPAEGGASLRAAGWVCEETTGGRQWVHTSGPRRSDDLGEKWRWAVMQPQRPTPRLPVEVDGAALTLFAEVAHG